MKFLLSALVLSLACGASIAQSYNGWKLVEVNDPESGNRVGYIYHTFAVGKKTVNDKSEKSITGLRLVCAVVGKDEPIIGVFWNDLSLDSPVKADIVVDGKQVGGNGMNWLQDGNLVYRTISSSPTLMKSLEDGKTVTITWLSRDNKKYTTAFDLSKYKEGLASFKSQCNMSV